MQVSGPVKEDTVIGPKIAAVERREARVPVQRHAGAFVRCPVVTSAFLALRSLMQMREGNEGAGPAPTNEGADESRPYVIETFARERGLFDM